MNTPRYAAAAAKLLAKHVAEPPTELLERERSVQTIERALRARARRRQMLLLAIAPASVAAAALLWFAPWRSQTREALMVQISASPAGKGAALRVGPRAQPVASDVQLQTGQRLDTPKDGGATLRLSTGTAMQLAGDTSFRVDSHGESQRFSLDRGELTAHVSKLAPGQRFLVDTPDAQIEVRGTRFRLRVLAQGEGCGEGSVTRLDVSEGVVEVRAASGVESIAAGENWPPGCRAQPALSVDPQPPSDSAPSASAGLERAVAPAHREPSPPAPSLERSTSLARQNDLFAEGVARRRLGDVPGALAAYEQLIRRFPASPLAENAMLERMRLLSGQNAARAREEARRYLVRYPGGFGAGEARRLTEER